MSVRVPSNQIVKSKYTIGKEYLVESTYKEYQGYYYELNGKFFAGKVFNTNALTLIKLDVTTVNHLLFNPLTYLYGKISGMNVNSQQVKSIIYQIGLTPDIRYFAYHISQNLIKEIDKDTFTNIQSDPLYKTTALTYNGGFSNKELMLAETKIPGITDFVHTLYTSPEIEESGLSS